MIPIDFFAYGSVLVQGHTVTLTPELVNEYFQLPDILELEKGWEEHPFFYPYDYNLAKALKIEDSGCCHPDQGSLALPLPDHAVLRDGRHKHTCCRRSSALATGTSWSPNLQ
ncbi:hypothetical protein ACOSP7_016624 [Xanthoceras sorbifolium]